MTFTLTDEEKSRIIMSGALSENRLRILEAIVRWTAAADRAYLEGANLHFNVCSTDPETEEQTKARLAEESAWEVLCDMGIVGEIGGPL